MAKTSNYKSFAYLENGEIQFTQYETEKTTSILDAGSYTIDYDEYPVNKVSLKIDECSETVKTHTFLEKERLDYLFESFFNPNVKNKIEGLGFYHKVGILLHGKEGTGKSTIMKYYYNQAIIHNQAIVFHLLKKNSYLKSCWDFIMNIRKIQDNPIIIVLDELDGYVDGSTMEALMKTIIDGNSSISNCIFFASTNYISKIPKAIKDRPSRFKYSIEVGGVENIDSIVEIITPILDGVASDEDIQVYANDLLGKTLDNIKQFCFDKIMAIKHYENKSEMKSVGFIVR